MDYQKIWFKSIYIGCVVLLWLLAGILVHWLMEWPMLYYLTKDFQKYSLAFSYQSWLAIHLVISFFIVITSITLGIYYGCKWYDYIYSKRRGHV